MMLPDIWNIVLIAWLTIDLIATAFDIWIRMRHEKWETEVVPKKDVELLRHFLEHDYDLVITTEDSYILRKFR
jgi:hypothetical protein